MARGRMISKSLSTSEKFAALVTVAGPLAEFCHALYPLIVIHTDDFGRLQGDPFTVKHVCYPASVRSQEDFTTGLKHLHAVDLIIWYLVGGKRYIQIEQFEIHQQGLHKRTRSNFPRFPGTSGNDREVPDQEKGREGKGRELKIPPTPLAGGRRRKRRGIGGGTNCDHEPRCATRHACIDRTLADSRKAHAS